MIASCNDRVLVRIVEKEEKPSLIIVPDKKKEFQIGQIVAIGNDVFSNGDVTRSLRNGDYVYTRKYAGLLLEYDDVEYVSLEIKEILAFSEELK